MKRGTAKPQAAIIVDNTSGFDENIAKYRLTLIIQHGEDKMTRTAEVSLTMLCLLLVAFITVGANGNEAEGKGGRFYFI